jgi:hypothetical protein
MAHKPQDIVIRVGVGEVYSMMVAEGTAWNPDVAKDMVNRIDELWRNTIESAVDAGLIDTSPLPRDSDDDDDDFMSDIDDLFSDREVD